jgi:hypothetical protein
MVQAGVVEVAGDQALASTVGLQQFTRVEFLGTGMQTGSRVLRIGTTALPVRCQGRARTRFLHPGVLSHL